MRTPRALSIAALMCAAFAIAGCNDKSMNPGPQPNNGTMTATIDGSSWSAVAISVSYQSGILAIGGSDATSRGVGVGLVPAPGPGTYTIGVGSTTSGNVTLVTGASWSASAIGGTGTVTLTSFTPTSASGTFSFTAVAIPGTAATGNKAVTNGTFDVTF